MLLSEHDLRLKLKLKLNTSCRNHQDWIAAHALLLSHPSPFFFSLPDMSEIFCLVIGLSILRINGISADSTWPLADPLTRYPYSVEMLRCKSTYHRNCHITQITPQLGAFSPNLCFLSAYSVLYLPADSQVFTPFSTLLAAVPSVKY